MSSKIAYATPASAVAANGTITFSYPDGTTAGDYATYGHSIVARGLGLTKFSQDAGTISVVFNSSDITVTYKGLTSIPANSTVVANFNVRGIGIEEPQVLLGAKRMFYSPIVRIDLGAPATADADAIVESQNLTAAGVYSVLAFNGVFGDPYGNAYAVMDVPRNVVAAWTGTAVLTVTGLDEYGDVMIEASASGTSFTGKKAFKRITSIAVSANVTSLTVGSADVLGLPVFLPATSHILATIEDNVFAYPFYYDGDDTGAPLAVTHTLPGTAVAGVQTTPTATTGDVRGTWDPTTAANGAKAFGLLVTLADPKYRGVDNYDG